MLLLFLKNINLNNLALHLHLMRKYQVSSVLNLVLLNTVVLILYTYLSFQLCRQEFWASSELNENTDYHSSKTTSLLHQRLNYVEETLF